MVVKMYVKVAFILLYYLVVVKLRYIFCLNFQFDWLSVY